LAINSGYTAIFCNDRYLRVQVQLRSNKHFTDQIKKDVLVCKIHKNHVTNLILFSIVGITDGSIKYPNIPKFCFQPDKKVQLTTFGP